MENLILGEEKKKNNYKLQKHSMSQILTIY